MFPKIPLQPFKKNKKFAKPVNMEYLKKLEVNKEIDVTICNALAVEMDEMWSFYHDKSHQLWLWWAFEHETNTPLAYTFGTREHKHLDVLLELLKPFHIRQVYADNNFAYKERISDDDLITGKTHTQPI